MRRTETDILLILCVHTQFFLLNCYNFFKELIFKRTYKKSVSIESDIRTHIGMQTRENEDSILTLHQRSVKLQKITSALIIFN